MFFVRFTGCTRYVFLFMAYVIKMIFLMEYFSNRMRERVINSKECNRSDIYNQVRKIDHFV